MHYPVMTERKVAFRWKISLKTLRRWRLDGEGPIWHKLFQHVRYHEADILEFERQSAQHWMAILGGPPAFTWRGTVRTHRRSERV